MKQFAICFFHCTVLHHCKEWHLMWFKCTMLSKEFGPLRWTHALTRFIELSPKPAATCLPGGKLQLTLDKIWHSLRTSFLPWLSGQDQTKTLRNQGFNTHWTTKTIHLQCLGPCWPCKQNGVSFTFRGSSPFFAPFTLKTIWCDNQKKHVEISNWLVVSTNLKNMLVKLDHFSKLIGVKLKKLWKTTTQQISEELVTQGWHYQAQIKNVDIAWLSRLAG